jgi:hypothetical protein
LKEVLIMGKNKDIIQAAVARVVSPCGNRLAGQVDALTKLIIRILLMVASALDTGYVEVCGLHRVEKKPAKTDPDTGKLLAPAEYEVVPDPDNKQIIPLTDFRVPAGLVTVLKAMRVAADDGCAKRHRFFLEPNPLDLSLLEQLLAGEGVPFVATDFPIAVETAFNLCSYRGWHWELVNLPDVKELYTTLDEWEALSDGDEMVVVLDKGSLPDGLSRFWGHNASVLTKLGYPLGQMDNESRFMEWMFEMLKPSFVNSQSRPSGSETTTT